jgi:rRNA-processing protein FCF1
MLITPHPGANPDNLLQTLRTVHTSASNEHGRGYDNAYQRLLGYLEWAMSAARLLRNQVRTEDLHTLVLTKRHETLLNNVGNLEGETRERLLNLLVDQELAERTETLEAAIQLMQPLRKRWGGRQQLVVADSSFFVHYPKKLAKMDLCEATGTHPYAGVHLLVPIAVIDELDRLKEASKPQARWRARHTLGVLDRALARDGRGTIGPADFPDPAAAEAVEREMTVEVIFDPPGHVRLPLDDDEIVDRALAVQVIAGQPVKFLTYDTGQGTRALLAGLDVKKFRDAPDPEQEPDWKTDKAKQGNGTRARRRERQASLGNPGDEA